VNLGARRSQEIEHQRRALHLRRRRERMPRHRHRDRGIRQVLDEHREEAVVASARGRRDPLRHLPLQKQHCPAHRCALVEQVEEDGRAEVVREVSADHHAPARAGRDRAQVEALRIRLYHLHLGKLRPQHRHQLAVALHRDHLRARRRQRAGEVPEAGAELDDKVAGTHARQPRQRRKQLLVAEEVLPPRLLRPEPVAAQQVGGLHSRHPGSADIAASARSPRRSLCAPAMAIIAALSVQSRGSGRCSAIPSAAHRSRASARSREFAATPPQRTIASSLADRAARTARWVSESQTASWKEAQRSASSWPAGTPRSRT